MILAGVTSSQEMALLAPALQLVVLLSGCAKAKTGVGLASILAPLSVHLDCVEVDVAVLPRTWGHLVVFVDVKGPSLAGAHHVVVGVLGFLLHVVLAGQLGLQVGDTAWFVEARGLRLRVVRFLLLAIVKVGVVLVHCWT